MRSGNKFLGHGNKPSGLLGGLKTSQSGRKSLPSTIPFSLTNNPRLRLYAGVIRGTPSGTGNPITWAFLTTGGHNVLSFNPSITPNGNEIIINFNSGKVVVFIVAPDETYASSVDYFIGATDNLDGTVSLSARYIIGTFYGQCVGNGTNWDLTRMSQFNIISNTISDIVFFPPKPYNTGTTNGQNLIYWKTATARYVGTTNGLWCKRTLFLRDVYDASGNTYPAAGVGSGASGAIKKGDVFYLSKGGVLNSLTLVAGDSVTALVDTPGQTNGNWQIDVGGGPVFGYQLVDSSGNAVTTNSSADIISIETGTPEVIPLSLTNDTDGYESIFVGGVSNFWIQAIIES